MVKRIYVEKKKPFAGRAKELKEEIAGYLGIRSVDEVRIFIRYDVENVSDEVFEQATMTVFSEPPVDILYREEIEIPSARCLRLFPGLLHAVFSAGSLPGFFMNWMQGWVLRFRKVCPMRSLSAPEFQRASLSLSSRLSAIARR